MIPRQVIEEYPAESQEVIRSAVAALTSIGVWDRLIQIEHIKMLTGAENQPVETLAEAILEGRKRVNFFKSMQTLGLESSKGTNNAQDTSI